MSHLKLQTNSHKINANLICSISTFIVTSSKSICPKIIWACWVCFDWTMDFYALPAGLGWIVGSTRLETQNDFSV